MKKFIAFFVSIWVFLFGKKGLKKIEEPVKAEPKTVTEKIEESNKKIIHRIQRMVPQHNNRKSHKNKRGVRSRHVQYIPSGRTIYHDKPR